MIIKFRNIIFLILGVFIIFASCHVLAQTKEEQCIESAKHSFKDPDSLKIVKNLGSRGQSVDNDNFFWLRFTGTNSYGGRIAANMACKKEGEIWIRDVNWEARTISKLQALMDARFDEIENKYTPPACNGFGCAEAQEAAKEAAARAIARQRREASSFGWKMTIQSAEDINNFAD